jgi:hypothetical protein
MVLAVEIVASWFDGSSECHVCQIRNFRIGKSGNSKFPLAEKSNVHVRHFVFLSTHLGYLSTET